MRLHSTKSIRYEVGFNPRTHAGCDAMISQLMPYYGGVSIHAPTRGATSESATAADSFEVSIHAPTRGATNFDRMQARNDISFNPRTHAGCDFRISDGISYRRRFNPRTHAGCDTFPTALQAIMQCFNPRTHAGCDSVHPTYVQIVPGFNPRTHAGCDSIIFCTYFLGI